MDKEQQALKEIKALRDEAEADGEDAIVVPYSAFVERAERRGLGFAISHQVSLSDMSRALVALGTSSPLEDIPVSEATGEIMWVLDQHGIDRPKVDGYDDYSFPTKAEPHR